MTGDYDFSDTDCSARRSAKRFAFCFAGACLVVGVVAVWGWV